MIRKSEYPHFRLSAVSLLPVLPEPSWHIEQYRLQVVFDIVRGKTAVWLIRNFLSKPFCDYLHLHWKAIIEIIRDDLPPTWKKSVKPTHW